MRDINRDIVFKHISAAESFNSLTVFLCTTFNKFSTLKGETIMSTETNKNFVERSTPSGAVLPVRPTARFLALTSFALFFALAVPLQVSAQTTMEWLVLKSSAQANAASGGDCTGECQEQLARAKAATAQYHNEAKALEDGFISTFHCVEAPGLGAMGIHYINPLRMMDTSVDASRPEALLFIRQNDGKMRLVGLEYVAPVMSNGAPWFGGANNPPPVIDNPAPTLFGRSFDGPMPGHGPGEPWHYDLHVWAWRDNPRGLFFPFNPKLSCQ